MDRRQPRWPRGTPVAPSGRGPGGGRFREDHGREGWAARVAALVPRRRRALRDLDGMMSFDDIAGYLGRADYDHLGHAGGAQASVEFLQFDDGRILARKEYVIPLDRWIDAELDTSVVGHAIGAPVPAVVRDLDRPGRVGNERALIMQYFQPSEATRGVVHWDVTDQLWDEARQRPDGRLIELLDIIVNNRDRHSKNVIFTEDGRAVGIDHGLATFAPPPDSVDQILRWVPTDVKGIIRVGPINPGGERTVQQVYFSPEAIREARRRVAQVARELDPDHWVSVQETLDWLESVSVGEHDLDG